MSACFCVRVSTACNRFSRLSTTGLISDVRVNFFGEPRVWVLRMMGATFCTLKSGTW